MSVHPQIASDPPAFHSPSFKEERLLILESCQSKFPFPRSALRLYLPALLDRLFEALVYRREYIEHIPESPSPSSGIELDQILFEFQILRSTVLDVLEPRLSASGRSFVHRVLDEEIRRTVARYASDIKESRRESESRLRIITDALPTLIAYVDTKERYTFCNEAYRGWFDVNPRELIGRKMGDVIRGEAYECFRRSLPFILKGKTVTYDAILPLSEGRDFYVQATFVPDRSPRDGQIQGYVGLIQDITERIRAERREKEARGKLEVSEKRFRELVEAIPAQVYTATADGYVAFLNRQFLDYVGLRAEDIPNWSWRSCIHPSQIDDFIKKWVLATRAGQPYECQIRLRHRSGEYRWHLNRVVPIRDESGQIIQWFGIATEIHAQKTAEAALNEALVARDEFVSIASHELKTPITTLKLQAQIRKRHLDRGNSDYFAPQRLQKMLETDLRQIDRLHRLVEDMLDVSRIHLGKFTIRREVTNLDDVVREVIERFFDQFEAVGCPVALDIETSAGGFRGMLDQYRFEQVVTNLLTNAMKYGAGRPVRICLSREGRNAILKVTDHGIGIAEENQVRIFERFERASSKSNVAGFGLGLFIVRQIVQLHGGVIHVDSRPGEGATFTVEIPLISEVAYS